ncbi:MAG: ABC transporter ATP-binding protein [Halanaerobiales bacterium]
MMGMPVEKPKDFKGTMRRLLEYLKPYKKKFVYVILSSILSTIFTILSPKVLGLAITRIFDGVMQKMQGVEGAGIDFSYVRNILLILVGLYLFSALFHYLQQYIMAGVAQDTVYNMRKDLNEKLSHLPLKFFDSRPHGDILSRVTNDIDNISNTLQQSVTQLIISVITLLGVVIMMLTISPWLTLIVFLTLPLYLFVTKPIVRRSQKYYSQRQKVLGDLNGHIEENYTAHIVVKAFTKEGKSIEKFSKMNDELYEVGWKSQFISGIIMPLMMTINNLGYIMVSVAGAIFVTRGMIQIGDVQAFIQYARQFTHPIQQTANIANILQSTVASAERVFEILDEEEEIPEKEDAETIEFPRGNVQFDDVSFGYNKDVPVIKELSIDVNSGQTIAIVGPTGAGKTTLVNLLMRFYEIDEGRITIDGVNISELRRRDLRSIFGMVLQDTWLFNGTIRDNIAYGSDGSSEEEIINAARTAHADHFIRTLPDGYDTVINEEASNISQGQKQLLTIARAILADPPILILDEATSSVDTRTEVLIQKAMDKLMAGRTNFVIAHRLSTIREADLILVMNEGEIIEKGKHDELLKQDGFYADLYNSQFTGGHLTDNAV